MEKYLYKYWQTFPFKYNSFDGQLDRFAKVCVVSVSNPQKVLDIIPIWGKKDEPRLRDIIQLIFKLEDGKALAPQENKLLEFIKKPIIGQFEEIPSKHGPLFRRFTRDEAKYGLCSKYDVGKPERDENGRVRVYNTIRVFRHYIYDSEFEKNNIPVSEDDKYYTTPEWDLNKMYDKYFGYRYFKRSQLTEPILI